MFVWEVLINDIGKGKISFLQETLLSFLQLVKVKQKIIMAVFMADRKIETNWAPVQRKQNKQKQMLHTTQIRLGLIL